MAAEAVGALRWWQRPVLYWHLRGCAECRARRAGFLSDAAMVKRLLGSPVAPFNVEDAMARVLVRSGTRRRARPFAVWAQWTAVATGVVVVVLALNTQSPYGSDRWGNDLRWLMNPDDSHGKSERLDDRQFIGRLRELQQAGTVDLVEDECCDDRDGEGPADDGLVVVTLAAQDAGLAVMYEDLDRSGSLTPGDVIRLVSRTLPPQVTLERHGPQFRPGSLP